MSITYHKATPSDAEGFAHCQIDSFMEDRFYQAAFGLKPDSQQEAYQEQLGYRIKRWQNRLDNPDIHWIKAVDQPTGAIVGICGCEVPEARRQRKDSKPSEEVQWPSGWDKQFLDLAERRTEEILEATGVEKEKLWYVAMMAVLPSHRGRGIAQDLMARGLQLADAAGEGMYLESTPAAKKVYEGNGFESVGIFEMPEGYISDVMIRKAQR